MRKIIDGICYDTKKAILLGHSNSGYSRKGDIRWSITTLYRTRSGKYFLHGSGGPGSSYALIDNEHAYTNGEMIIPMSQPDVIVWAEEYLPDEKIKLVLKDIRQEAKRHNIEVPVILKIASQELNERETQRKHFLIQAKETSLQICRATYIDW